MSAETTSVLDATNRMADTFFNGRKAVGPKPAVSVEELIRRKVSHVRLGEKVYRIEAKEVETTK